LINIAINGFGRIGKNVARLLLESQDLQSNINLVAINDLGEISSNAHLLKYDSVHGKSFESISTTDDSINIDGKEILYSSIKNPSALPWQELNIDIVLDCSGVFTSKELAFAHIDAGAKRVIVSAPTTNADKTIVMGVNHNELRSNDLIISNASCTTNCLAPIAMVLHNLFGIKSGIINTIHSYTNDQNLLDMSHTDLYRARAANLSIIPSKTGAAKAISLVIPELSGKLTGMATRVPVQNVSMLDLTVTLEKDVTIDVIKKSLEDASVNELKNILSVNSEKLVSIDFNQNTASSIIDTNFIEKVGDQFKLISWYDNEWAFSSRMLDLTLFINNFLEKEDELSGYSLLAGQKARNKSKNFIAN